MQTVQDPSILQTETNQGEESLNPNAGRETIHRVPSNHRQAERKLIGLIHDGTFEIDSEGRIWRLKKKMGCRWHGTKIIEVPRQRAEHKTPQGYLQIRAMMKGKRVCGLSHRLVWQHLFGNIPDGMVTNHKNGIKDDNRPENLEIVTYSENMRHAFKSGLKEQWGERNPGAKLSNDKVTEIRNLYATGDYLQIELASQYKVSFQTISKIVRGERRPKQGGPIDSSDHRFIASERDPISGQFISKKAAGRLLDGRTWNEMPPAARQEPGP